MKLLKQKFAYSTYPFFAIPYSALNVYSLPLFSSPHLALLLVPVNIEWFGKLPGYITVYQYFRIAVCSIVEYRGKSHPS